MTRKCVLCKETNYKNSYSFFSAPKDPETRGKWTEAIAIDNYVVGDDTYVCSKHFTPDDIITHWVSGVPPHVVTIKYKKCRLRPGAIPSTSCESMNNLSNNREEEEYDEFEVNRGSGSAVVRRPFLFAGTAKETFLVPREEKTPEHSGIDGPDDESTNERVTTFVYEKSETRVVSNSVNDDSSEETNHSTVPENPDEERAEPSVANIELVGKFEYRENEEESRIVYVEAVNCGEADCTEEETEDDVLPAKRARVADSRPTEIPPSTAEDSSTDMWDSVSNDDATREDRGVCRNFTKRSKDRCPDVAGTHTPDPLDIGSEAASETVAKAMLFEDLLDVYTEVRLPGGWTSMVTSKGHGTTVVYAYTSMTKSGLPYVDKQVFLKSDMKLRCGAANKEIDPRIHNLVRDGRNRTVRTLADVEELIDEFHRRIVCEGCAGEKTRPEDIERSSAYRDASGKWRHTECPIIVNNGSSRCSKCGTLDGSLTRSRARRHNAEAHDFATAMTKKEKTIRVLQRLLRKTNKRNRRFETARESVEGKFESIAKEPQRVFAETLATLNMPKIQKIMVKECLRSSVSENGGTKYSETWVFLCLLLYIESPRMYRYMLLNRYMVLPSMRIIRRYLHRIKTDAQFYNLFQRTVEPFQPGERDDEKEPT